MPPVNASAAEYKSRVGVGPLYVAEVLKDDATEYLADTPQPFAPVAELSAEPSTASETQYADDKPFDTIDSEGNTKMPLTVTALPLEMLALVTGRVYDAASGQIWDNGDPAEAKYFALLFKSMKSNGKYRYFSYFKGKFENPKDEAATVKEKKDIKQTQITFNAQRTIHQFNLGTKTDSMKRVIGDDDIVNFAAGPTWFSQVQTPGVTTPAALALSSSSPAAAATGVLVTVTLTLTFNNALNGAAIYNVALINSATGALVAGVNTLDTATKKVLTVGHTANLAAATLHRIVYSVVDAFGLHLAGVVSFTTA